MFYDSFVRSGFTCVPFLGQDIIDVLLNLFRHCFFMYDMYKTLE